MTNWRCESCDKLIKPNPDAIKAGDKVTFTVSKTSGRSTRLRAVEAKVMEDLGNGNLLVKGKGRMGEKVVRKEAVAPADAPTSLSYAFIGTCECGGAA